MNAKEIIKVKKNDLINIPSEHCIFMSNGYSALHFYQSTLSEEYPSIKTWNDLFNTFKPKKFELHDFNGENKDIVLIDMTKIERFICSIGSVNRYSLLDRMKEDCRYFLGNGCGYEPHLWGLSVKDHIWYMKALWLLFPINDKPQWISMSDILSYEKEMNLILNK